MKTSGDGMKAINILLFDNLLSMLNDIKVIYRENKVKVDNYFYFDSVDYGDFEDFGHFMADHQVEASIEGINFDISMNREIDEDELNRLYILVRNIHKEFIQFRDDDGEIRVDNIIQSKINKVIWV